MKTYFFVLSFITLLVFSTFSSLHAQYDSEGNHFTDSLKNTQPILITTANHRAIFDAPQDTIYIYHLVSEGESIEFILNMYQLCAPCFAKWNNYPYSGMTNFKRQRLYAGEYLKVALQTEYYKGFPSNPHFRYQYVDINKKTPLYKIAQQYGISVMELKQWNNFNEYVYNVEANTKIIVDKKIYKYVCPCKGKE